MSSIKKSFIVTYKKEFRGPDQTLVERHPLMVERVILNRLTPAALTNHKWRSHSAYNRIIREKPMCPELEKEEELFNVVPKPKGEKYKKEGI